MEQPMGAGVDVGERKERTVMIKSNKNQVQEQNSAQDGRELPERDSAKRTIKYFYFRKYRK
jgi:hypothetical protein